MDTLSGFRPGRGPGTNAALGCVSALEYTLQVLAWARQQRRQPNVEAIMRRWDVSRSTAYRYLHALRAARDGGGRPGLRRVFEFLVLVEDGGLGAAELAAELGVHRSTAFKWRRAYLNYRAAQGRGCHAA